ncbi:P-loop containing nucleoside triphosphate hydrolase protein [Hypoxylon argillaceum]|nr:P-loop containing nucleoside triphosphate hydrolase protein [Hypoxylon argillaceum]
MTRHPATRPPVRPRASSQQRDRALMPPPSQPTKASFPCHTLPAARNNLFFGREDILNLLHSWLTPFPTCASLMSVVLTGLGGVGKTQIALEYAYQSHKVFDAIFWISAEDSSSMYQSFSRAAVEALKLPSARLNDHEKNRVVLRRWLRNTSKTWLLVFDNVDDYAMLKRFWPTSESGAIIVTTRDTAINDTAFRRGLVPSIKEVGGFDDEEGAEFLLHMTLRTEYGCEEEELAAHELSHHLGGMPLGICQISPIITSKNLTFKKFEAMYMEDEDHFHKQREVGWESQGYEHGLHTVWESAFDNLTKDARNCLEVIAFLNSDFIYHELFKDAKVDELPEKLCFCRDELSLSNAVRELSRHGLVTTSRYHIRTNPLVRRKFQARVENAQLQFEAATKLMVDKQPYGPSIKDKDNASILAAFIFHARQIVTNVKISYSTSKPLEIIDTHFDNLVCNLLEYQNDSPLLTDLNDILVAYRMLSGREYVPLFQTALV